MIFNDKKLKELNSLDRQFNDLFRRGDYGKKEPMQNPLNVQAVLNKHFNHNIPVYINNSLNNAIKYNLVFKIDEESINIVLTNEAYIINRLREIKSLGLDFKSKASLVSKSGNFNILKEVLLLGADINYKNKEGNTALSLSIKRNSKEIVKWLWNYPELDKNALDNDGVSYSVLAYTHEHYEIVKEILDTNPKNLANISNGNQTLLHVIKKVTNKNKKQTKSYFFALQIEKEVMDYLYKNHFDLFYLKDFRGKIPLDNDKFDMKLYITKKLNDKMMNELEDKVTIKTLKL